MGSVNRPFVVVITAIFIFKFENVNCEIIRRDRRGEDFFLDVMQFKVP